MSPVWNEWRETVCTCDSPFLVSSDFFQEFLDVLVVAHRAKVFFEILNCFMMSQDVSSSARDVHHIRACLLNDFGNLKLERGWKVGQSMSTRVYILLKAYQQLRSSQSRQLDSSDSGAESGVGDCLQTPDEDLHVLLACGLVEIEVCSCALNHFTAISETLVNRVLWQCVAMC